MLHAQQSGETRNHRANLQALTAHRGEQSCRKSKKWSKRSTGRRPCGSSTERAAVAAAAASPRRWARWTRSPRTCTTRSRPAGCRPRRCWHRSAAAIRPRWRSLNPGEVVLDLGSGGGIDVLLSAKRVGPTGKAYGLDMTDEMLALARENQRKSGRRKRGVPEGRDREHPAARQHRGPHHFQLRHQSLGGQGPRAARGVPGAEAGRALRRLRRGGARRNAARDPPQRRAVGGLPGGRAGGKRLHGEAAGGGFRRRSRSSRRASTTWRTRASFSPATASTWTRSRRWWTAASSAASSARASRRSSQWGRSPTCPRRYPDAHDAAPHCQLPPRSPPWAPKPSSRSAYRPLPLGLGEAARLAAASSCASRPTA